MMVIYLQFVSICKIKMTRIKWTKYCFIFGAYALFLNTALLILLSSNDDNYVRLIIIVVRVA